MIYATRNLLTSWTFGWFIILLNSSLMWFLKPCNPLTIIWSFRPRLNYWFHPSLIFFYHPATHWHQLKIQTTFILLLSSLIMYDFRNPATHWPVESSDDLYTIALFPNMICNPETYVQLNIQMISILLISSLTWFLKPCKPLTISWTFRTLLYYWFHSSLILLLSP